MSPRRRARVIAGVMFVGLIMMFLCYRYFPGREVVRLSLAVGIGFAIFFVAGRLGRELPGHEEAKAALEPYDPLRAVPRLCQFVLSGGRSPSRRRAAIALVVVGILVIITIMQRVLPPWPWAALLAVVVMIVLTTTAYLHIKRSQKG